MSFRIPHHVVAKFFAPNLALAHLAPLGTTTDTTGVRPSIHRAKLKTVEPWPVLCPNPRCNATHYTTNIRKKYCCDNCANAHRVALCRARRSAGTILDAKRQANREWLSFYMNDIHGDGSTPPPKFRGRPTRIQRAAVDEYHRLRKIKQMRRQGST